MTVFDAESSDLPRRFCRVLGICAQYYCEEWYGMACGSERSVCNDESSYMPRSFCQGNGDLPAILFSGLLLHGLWLRSTILINRIAVPWCLEFACCAYGCLDMEVLRKGVAEHSCVNIPAKATILAGNLFFTEPNLQKNGPQKDPTGFINPT